MSSTQKDLSLFLYLGHSGAAISFKKLNILLYKLWHLVLHYQHMATQNKSYQHQRLPIQNMDSIR